VKSNGGQSFGTPRDTRFRPHVQLLERTGKSKLTCTLCKQTLVILLLIGDLSFVRHDSEHLGCCMARLSGVNNDMIHEITSLSFNFFHPISTLSPTSKSSMSSKSGMKIKSTKESFLLGGITCISATLNSHVILISEDHLILKPFSDNHMNLFCFMFYSWYCTELNKYCVSKKCRHWSNPGNNFIFMHGNINLCLCLCLCLRLVPK
jgi:hypothetical protein